MTYYVGLMVATLAGGACGLVFGVGVCALIGWWHGWRGA